MIRASTLSGYLEHTYLVEHFGLSPEYANELRRVVRMLNASAGYEVTLAELSPAILCRFLASLLESGLSPVTVNNKRRELITLWRAAHAAQLAQRPPEERIKRLREPIPLPTAWTAEECNRIFAVANALPGMVAGLPRNLWWLSLFLSVYSVGERIKATVLARSRDCDLDAGTLIIRWQHHKISRSRLVKLQPEAVEAVRAIHDPERKRLWPWPHCREHFFRQARKIIESAGVPCPKGKKDGKNLFQRLRRTSGSMVEAAGGDGARHLGNTRAVFERHYMAPSLCGGSQIDLLPRPKF